MAPIWKPQSNEVLLHWITCIEEEASDKLNSWEINFIESVANRVRAGYTLSQKQEEILERIYADKTS